MSGVCDVYGFYFFLFKKKCYVHCNFHRFFKRDKRKIIQIEKVGVTYGKEKNG